MATRVHVFDVDTPAGTLRTSPQSVLLNFPAGRVERIEVLVPPGPSGLFGWAIDHSNQRILPFESAGFIIADGEVIKWPLERFPGGRGWTVVTFNEDVYSHEIHVRLLIEDQVTDERGEALRLVGSAASTVGMTGG